jgi:hypothetical protein
MSADGDWAVDECRLGSESGGEGRALMSNHASSSVLCTSSGSGYSYLAVSTSMIDPVLERTLAMGLEGDVGDGRALMRAWPRVLIVLSTGVILGFFSTRLICRLFVVSCVYDGRLALTIVPLESLQSLFLVARTPNPSPPASSSFSLWRAMCRSSNIVSIG